MDNQDVLEVIEKLNLKVNKNKDISWLTFSTDEIKNIKAALYFVDKNSMIKSCMKSDGILEIYIENHDKDCKDWVFVR